MTAVLPFLTRRPQTKKELAERMGVPQRTVEALINEARHEDGMLTGRLSPGTPPDWSVVTEAATPDDAARFALNGRYASDAAKAATGDSGIALVDIAGPDRPSHWHSDGYDEWVMPVRIGATVDA